LLGGVGWPAVGDPDAEVGDPLGDPEVGDPVVGEPVVGDPELGDPDVGDPELGEPLPDADVGTGGGGACVGAFWNIRIAISSARHISSSMSSHDARIDSHPDRSCRPGHGSGHSRQAPGRPCSIQ